MNFFAAARLFYTLAVAETKCKLRRRRLWGYFMRNKKKKIMNVNQHFSVIVQDSETDE